MTAPVYDKQDQFEKIASGLLNGEQVILTSVPHNRVNAVSFVSNKSMLGKFASTGSIAVSAGGQTYEVEFRGDEKARHAHDAILWHMLNPR